MQNQNLKTQEITEDILIIGGGPTGSFLAHIFATKYNYKVRVIDRYPDFSDPTTRFEDRSGIMSMSYRTTALFEKFGLAKEFRDIVLPLDSMTFAIADIQMKNDFIPGKKLFFHQVTRRDLNAFLLQVNKKNENITYEFDTKITNLDIKNKTFQSENRATNETLIRKFKFLLGADGYNSQVRQGIDQQLIKDRNLPADTVLTKIEEFPYYCKNIYMPNYAGHLQQQDEVKQGKYPLYEKLDKKYRTTAKKLAGKYIVDPSTLYCYGANNFIAFSGPFSDGKSNVVIGIPDKKDTLQKFLDNHPELKDSFRYSLTPNVNDEELDTDEKIHEFCANHIPQFYGLVPDMVEQWKTAPNFRAQAVFCDNWFYESEACLFGDSCDGMPYVSANGFNVSAVSIGKFFNILDEKLQNDHSKFLSDSTVRSEIFSLYKEACYQDARACQEGDVRDAIFPCLAYAQNPKFPLFAAVEQHLYKECEGIYSSKINFCFFTQDSFYSGHTKVKLFNDYICSKIENAEKFEDIDLSNCKQELTELLEKNNLTVNYTIDPSCMY